ncbi:MAG: hypothetical protein ACRDIC_06040 [bacterium]
MATRGLWLGRNSRADDGMIERCNCPLAINTDRILGDRQLCPYPADGEDGLCSMCREVCLPILREVRR